MKSRTPPSMEKKRLKEKHRHVMATSKSSSQACQMHTPFVPKFLSGGPHLTLAKLLKLVPLGTSVPPLVSLVTEIQNLAQHSMN